MASLPKQHPNIDQTLSVRAGKFRRYHGEGAKQWLDIKTQLKNLRDLFYFIVGFFQSLVLLLRVKPDAIFIKGGFVGVPVGLAAAFWRIPFVTHDSDAIPGLANRIISRWASAHAVALPAENYAYPKNKTHYVGVPVNPEFAPLSTSQQVAWRSELGLKAKGQVICITGGGLGAVRLNHSIVHAAPLLFVKYPDLQIIHIAGPGKEKDLETLYHESLSADIVNSIHVYGFVSDFHKYSGVSDVIVTRAGANSLADFAMQSKACIVVPNPQLTGGHQTKNAEVLAKEKAIVMISEDSISNDGAVLVSAICDLLDSPSERKSLGNHLHSTSKPDAAEKLAKLVLSFARKVESAR